MRILLEYIIVFIVVYIIDYIMIVNPNKKYNSKKLLPELIYLKKIYKIEIKKEDYLYFLYITSFINTLIITTIYIIIIYLVKNLILKFVIGLILLVLMTIICYGLLGRYYIWKEGR